MLCKILFGFYYEYVNSYKKNGSQSIHSEGLNENGMHGEL